MGIKIDGKEITGPTKEQYMDYLEYQRELRLEVAQKKLDSLAPKE